MAQALIHKAWKDQNNAYLSVTVSADGTDPLGNLTSVCYIGAVPLVELAGLTNPQIKAALIAAVQAERNRSLALAPATPTDLGIAGTITV